MNWKRNVAFVVFFIFLAAFTMGTDECQTTKQQPVSDSGVVKASAKVKTQASGMTLEQENIKKRVEMENEPGTISHLYIISAFSGDVIIYSTVKGKVTSSGKRLTPKTLAGDTSRTTDGLLPITIGGNDYYTTEVLQDDGSYGSSIPYLYWWDTKGLYHQHYVSGGQIIHIAEKPLVVPKVIINMEQQ